MTDNKTATERLRDLLDERGVEYETDDNEKYLNTLWNTADRDANPMNVLFQEPLDGIPGTIGTWTELHIGKATSEQAIAATLGSGTLTAEQVENIVYRNTEFYEGGDVDVQAITDELNAELRKVMKR